MTLCACGKPADTFGGMCDRCASLQMLGLDRHALPEEIESTYLTLVKVWHPDRFPSDSDLRRTAEEKLKEINAAHDFLVSGPPRPQLPRTADQPESSLIPKKSQTPRPFQTDPEAEESDEVRKILRRQKKSIVPSIMLKVGFAIGSVALIALIWLSADSILASNPKTQRSWEEMKAEVGRELHSNEERLAPGADKPQQSPAETAPATPAPAAPTTPAPARTAPAQPGPKELEKPVKALGHLKGAQPFVTSGLTPLEVLSALGKPTSSTGEKMLYGASEIDFKNGQVAGWKIDPKAPIRVKLWPDSAPVPGLSTFGVGSSKSDVIALQGTPTLFSDNEFGYGSSLVFFQNNRVVSWKEDPSSVRLRVPR
jgi:curved DNA-binding protein CbpA